MSRMGDTIRAARVKIGMTEKQLAKKTGNAENFIKEIESGRRIPSDDQARRILKVLGCDNPLSTELDVAAVRAVKAAEFTPAQSGGSPVESSARLKLVFRLK